MLLLCSLSIATVQLIYLKKQAKKKNKSNVIVGKHTSIQHIHKFSINTPHPSLNTHQNIPFFPHFQMLLLLLHSYRFLLCIRVLCHLALILPKMCWLSGIFLTQNWLCPLLRTLVRGETTKVTSKIDIQILVLKLLKENVLLRNKELFQSPPLYLIW